MARLSVVRRLIRPSPAHSSKARWGRCAHHPGFAGDFAKAAWLRRRSISRPHTKHPASQHHRCGGCGGVALRDVSWWRTWGGSLQGLHASTTGERAQWSSAGSSTHQSCQPRTFHTASAKSGPAASGRKCSNGGQAIVLASIRRLRVENGDRTPQSPSDRYRVASCGTHPSVRSLQMKVSGTAAVTCAGQLRAAMLQRLQPLESNR
jgi:hypothetical protein